MNKDTKKMLMGDLMGEMMPEMMPIELLEHEDFLAIAATEMIDTEGDIIRIDGLDYSGYHNPDQNKHMKLLAGHKISASDSGLPLIVGRVERFIRTTVKDHKALLFTGSFARDREGQLTPLSQAYKSLMPKYLNQFSVGAMITKVADIETGLDIQKANLYEVSFVTVPANSEAETLIMKSINKASTNNALDSYIEKTQKILDYLVERVDNLEATIVAQQVKRDLVQPEEPKTQEIEPKDYVEVQKTLEKLNLLLKGEK